MQPVVLRTERFVLSAPGPADVDAVYAACQDPDVQRYTTVPVPYSVDDAASFVTEYVAQSWAGDTEYVFGIRTEFEAPLMGVVSWQRTRQAVGFWLGAAHRGDGVMTEALRGVLDWIFSHDEVELVHWEAYEGNLGSATVAQRTGFRWKGEGLCLVVDRTGAHPWGWLGELRRDELGTVQPHHEWPVLA